MVKEQVSSTTIGKMRMQFWRDTIKSIYAVRQLSLWMSSPLSHLTFRENPLNIQLQSPYTKLCKRLTSLPIISKESLMPVYVASIIILRLTTKSDINQGYRPGKSHPHDSRIPPCLLGIYIINYPLRSPSLTFPSALIWLLTCDIPSWGSSFAQYGTPCSTVSCVSRSPRNPSGDYRKARCIPRRSLPTRRGSRRHKWCDIWARMCGKGRTRCGKRACWTRWQNSFRYFAHIPVRGMVHFRKLEAIRTLTLLHLGAYRKLPLATRGAQLWCLPSFITTQGLETTIPCLGFKAETDILILLVLLVLCPFREVFSNIILNSDHLSIVVSLV